jgi:hypothetical protein
MAIYKRGKIYWCALRCFSEAARIITAGGFCDEQRSEIGNRIGWYSRGEL